MKDVFSKIKLEENEKVELVVKRSNLGVVMIWSTVIFLISLVTAFIAMVPFMMRDLNGQMLFEFNKDAIFYLYIIILVFYLSIFFGGIISTFVYKNNFLYVTNKRLIHINTTSLFSSSTNIIDLKSIEDASFKQVGIWQYLLRYGTIRMATVGDETTYSFKYVDTPTDELAKITHLIHKEKQEEK